MCCSTVNFQTACRSFPCPILLRIRQLIECRQTRLLDGRNVHEHVFTAALRLNKSIALGRMNHFTVPFGIIAPVSLRADEYVTRTGRKASAPTWTRDPPRSMWRVFIISTGHHQVVCF